MNNSALNCRFVQCYNTRILTAKLSQYYLLIIQLNFYNRTITRFIADDKVVYQRVRREIWLASNNSWTRRRLKRLSWRSRLIMRTLERRMAVSCEISQSDQCLFDLSSGLRTRFSTASRRTSSPAAWLPDNCTSLAEFLQQTIDASKFPTLVGKFTQQPSCTIPLWQIEILKSESHFPVKFSWFCLTFIARQHTDARYWYSNSVSLSVRSFVTFRYQMKTA